MRCDWCKCDGHTSKDPAIACVLGLQAKLMRMEVALQKIMDIGFNTPEGKRWSESDHDIYNVANSALNPEPDITQETP